MLAPEFVHLQYRGGTLHRAPVDNVAEQNFIDVVEAKRSMMLDLPDASDGLQTNRVDTYTATNGLSNTPIRYLDSGDYKHAVKGIEASSHSDGMYIHAAGMIIVRRNCRLEELNSTTITESFAVHERAHATHFSTPIAVMHTTTGRLLWKQSMTTCDTTRSGFGVNVRGGKRGSFLEEAYAEYERGRFVEDFDMTNDFTMGAGNYGRVRESGIPLKYFYKQGNQGEQSSLTFAPGALGASILDTFINRDPENLWILRNARKNTEGLRHFIVRLNAYVPELYPRLMHATNTSQIASLIRETRKA